MLRGGWEVLSNVLTQSVIAKQIIPYFSNFKHLKMSKVLITAKRERSLPWEIWGRRQGGGGRKRYGRYWEEWKGQETAERKAKRPHLPVTSLIYSIRQCLEKKNDKLFGQPTILRELDWPDTGAGVEGKLENTRGFNPCLLQRGAK